MKNFLRKGITNTRRSSSDKRRAVAANAQNFMNMHADAKFVTAEFFYNPMINSSHKAKALLFHNRARKHGLVVKTVPQKDGIVMITFTGPSGTMQKILNASSNTTRRSSSGSKRSTSKRRH